jgi:hypothetical protein
MKNETIKQFTPITVEQAGEMLRDNGWKPVKGLYASSPCFHKDEVTLMGIACGHNMPFIDDTEGCWEELFTVTDINPCQAPDGCPELEPWMAYVGRTGDIPEAKNKYFAACPDHHGWSSHFSGTGTMGHYYAIDVRTEWSKREYPEHCRIRNYQEPDPLNELLFSLSKSCTPQTCGNLYTAAEMRLAYELNNNPNNPTK